MKTAKRKQPTPLTTGQAAERLGIEPSSVWQLIRRGLLAAVKSGRDWLVDPAEVARYRRHRRRPGRPAKA